MMRLLRRLPTRRVEMLASLLLVLSCLILAGFLNDQFAREASLLLILITLEIILPLAMGLLSAGLLAGDPALDLLLSAHRPAWQTLLERLLFIGGVGALLASVALVLAAGWDLPLPKNGPAQIYIWLSPMGFYMGLSSVAALLRGKMLDGVLAVLGVMGVSLMMVTQIPRLCAGNAPGTPCIGWLASPMMTLGNPTDAYWPINRLLWLLLGVALLSLSLRLVRREEAILHEVSRE
jgi:hypothetical protein